MTPLGARKTSSWQPLRPPWIGLSATILAVLLAISLVWQLGDLWSAVWKLPGGRWGVPPPLLWLLGYGVAALCIWQYWKGQNWARVAVLLWAALVVARALGVLADHNLDPAALMGHPLTFLQSMVAVILLYWLNTPPLRAWFTKTSGGPGALLSQRLLGKLCTAVELRPPDPETASSWRIGLGHGAELVLWCPWRIVLDGNLAFAYTPAAIPQWSNASADLESASMQDPEPNPVPDSPQEARRLLKNLRVTAVRIAPVSSDLVVGFEMGIELQTWTQPPVAGRADLPHSSSGPQWRYGDAAVIVIADETGVNPRSATQLYGLGGEAPGP